MIVQKEVDYPTMNIEALLRDFFRCIEKKYPLLTRELLDEK